MSTKWTKTPPKEQGFYWHWNGDLDCGPFPLHVLYSGTSGKCFVGLGQSGFFDPTDCGERPHT